MKVTARASNEEFKVEASFRKGKVSSFLDDLIKLCAEHSTSITTSLEGTVVHFYNWDCFIKLEADFKGASLYWPRIQTEIVVQRKKGE